MIDDDQHEFQALQSVISALSPLEGEARRRIIDSASTFLQVPRSGPSPSPAPSSSLPPAGGHGSTSYPSFSDDTAPTPKDFLFEKQPRTDVERIAVLAYYLTHYRDTPHFKTLDLSKLNTEAAQPKFSNAADSSANAVKRGYLVPSQKGQRQISAAGERFVMALPDRELAREAMASVAPRKAAKRAAPKKPAGA